MNEAQEKHAKLLQAHLESVRATLLALPPGRLVSVVLTDLEKLELIAHKAVQTALA